MRTEVQIKWMTRSKVHEMLAHSWGALGIGWWSQQLCPRELGWNAFPGCLSKRGYWLGIIVTNWCMQVCKMIKSATRGMWSNRCLWAREGFRQMIHISPVMPGTVMREVTTLGLLLISIFCGMLLLIPVLQRRYRCEDFAILGWNKAYFRFVPNLLLQSFSNLRQ